MPESYVYQEQACMRPLRQEFTDAALKSALNSNGGWKTITSRQQGSAVVLQAAQNGEVNKQISETEPAAICDVQCD